MDYEAELYEINRALQEMSYADLEKICRAYAYSIEEFGKFALLSDVAGLAYLNL